jgi:hypothetical protein
MVDQSGSETIDVQVEVENLERWRRESPAAPVTGTCAS